MKHYRVNENLKFLEAIFVALVYATIEKFQLRPHGTNG